MEQRRNSESFRDGQTFFDKEDFLTVFNDFDENGVLVLQHDHMQRYSNQQRRS